MKRLHRLVTNSDIVARTDWGLARLDSWKMLDYNWTRNRLITDQAQGERKRELMDKNEVYLGTSLLQKDLRVRIPKTSLENLGLKPGETEFNIYIDIDRSCIILRPADKNDEQ